MASHACIVWLSDVIKLSPKFKYSSTKIVTIRSYLTILSLGHIKRKDHILLSHAIICGFGPRNSKFQQPGILRTNQRTLELLTSSKQDLARPMDDICTD